MNTPNLLSFLPDVGQKVPVPGGFIVCEGWGATRRAGSVSGEVTLRFFVSEAEYEKARVRELRAVPALENGEVHHQGAPCTSELKRGPGDSILNPGAMYKLGFRNNNCIGCVKARDNLDYWKRVRKFLPAIFLHRAGTERRLGVTINRITRGGVRTEIYLDEIEEGDPKGADPNVQCGLFCMAEADAMMAGADQFLKAEAPGCRGRAVGGCHQSGPDPARSLKRVASASQKTPPPSAGPSEDCAGANDGTQSQ